MEKYLTGGYLTDSETWSEAMASSEAVAGSGRSAAKA